MRRLLNCITHDEPDRKQAFRQKAQPEFSRTFKEFSIDKGPISCLAIDAKFEMIAVGGTQHNSVILIKRKPRLEIHKTLTNHTKPLTACKFFQDFDNKQRIITLGYDKVICDFDIESGKVNKKYSKSSVPLVADLLGSLLVVGYEDGSIRLWLLNKWKEGLAAKRLHKT